MLRVNEVPRNEHFPTIIEESREKEKQRENRRNNPNKVFVNKKGMRY